MSRSSPETNRLIVEALAAGKYEATADGHIIDHRPRGGGPSKLLRERNLAGYRAVNIRFNGKSRHVLVHRVILFAFHGEPALPHLECNHKNGNRADNRPENLEWVTPGENLTHAYRVLKSKKPVQLPGAENPMARLSDEQVLMIRCLQANGFRNSAIARVFGVSHPTVRLIQTEVTWGRESKDDDAH